MLVLIILVLASSEPAAPHEEDTGLAGDAPMKTVSEETQFSVELDVVDYTTKVASETLVTEVPEPTTLDLPSDQNTSSINSNEEELDTEGDDEEDEIGEEETMFTSPESADLETCKSSQD